MKVITISGKAESGKDTAAGILRDNLEELGYSVLICHYADLLKYICKQYFGWNGKKDEQGRSLLQIVGTETIRKQNKDYWVDFIVQLLKFFPDEWDFVVIPDTRFPNEIEKIKENFNGVAVKICRPGYENHLTEEQRAHLSETALDGYAFDYTITNKGDISDLREDIKTMINRIFFKDMNESLVNKIKNGRHKD